MTSPELQPVVDIVGGENQRLDRRPPDRLEDQNDTHSKEVHKWCTPNKKSLERRPLKNITDIEKTLGRQESDVQSKTSENKWGQLRADERQFLLVGEDQLE